MQFSLRYDEEIWELTHHEKEVTVLVIHWEITAKFLMVPIDSNGFRSFVYSKNRLLARDVEASIVPYISPRKETSMQQAQSEGALR